MKGFYILSIIILSAIIGCTKSGSDSNVDSGLQPYFDSFIKEAADRNRFFSEEDLKIKVVFTDISDPGVLGFCRFNQNEPDVVQIDRIHWRTFDEATKEFVMFHELGHCLLSRLHRDDTDNQGRCISLMHSSLGLCDFDFTGQRRDGYIDELFQ